MRALTMIFAVGLGALVLASFAGALHPAGDSLAVFRLPLAAVFALVVIWAPWPRRVRWPLALVALVVMAQIALPRWFAAEAAGGHDWRLYQQNLLWNRSDNTTWLGAVGAARPDMLTLQEVSVRNLPLLEALDADYPTQVVCPIAHVGAVAVLSRFPAVEGSGRCPGQGAVAAVQLDTDHGPVWLVSIHLLWPWPGGQAAQLDDLLPFLENLDGHVIIGGDFNAVGWSHTISRIAAATGTARIGPSDATFHLPYLGMPVTIDHVLTGPAHGQKVEVMGKFGSDHHGLLAHLTRPAR